MAKIIFVGKSKGRSMAPFINQNDKLYIEKVKLGKIRVGDIVVSRRKGDFFAHRVIAVKKGQIITKGDNSPFFDHPQTINTVFGKIIKIEGKYGVLDPNLPFARLVNYYFLFFSLTTYHLPMILRIILIKLLRGRKILIKLLAKKG